MRIFPVTRSGARIRHVLAELGAHAEADQDELPEARGIGHGERVGRDPVERVAVGRRIGLAVPAESYSPRAIGQVEVLDRRVEVAPGPAQPCMKSRSGGPSPAVA